MKEAIFYEKRDENKVRCSLCSHRCIIKEDKRGICGVRENRNGTLYTLVYDKVISQNVDPIEKKPIFHLYPGSSSFSIATVGCSFKCQHCQNYQISQMSKDKGIIIGNKVTPKEIVESAKRSGCKSISYTYTEPTIFYELAYETAILATEQGIMNVFVTNGYITPEALTTIHPYLHAANIDLKAFNDHFYRKICGARLQPVLDSIRLYKKLGIWIEITTLIIPTYNDSEEELRKIAEFIKDVGEDIPWHVTQFYSTYKLLGLPRTSIKSLNKAREMGLKLGLRYVYEGNVPGSEGESTYCYNCHELLIRRYGYTISQNNIISSQCPKCNAKIDGIGL
ncbi:MAG: AmmeMemoRadiSam system radical SAM enzyme [Nitrospinae bacterium]|nr:AmmeMemoRadiSam system radical SAM enzyme [Nitrospinota bacterium]